MQASPEQLNCWLGRESAGEPIQIATEDSDLAALRARSESAPCAFSDRVMRSAVAGLAPDSVADAGDYGVEGVHGNEGVSQYHRPFAREHDGRAAIGVVTQHVDANAPYRCGGVDDAANYHISGGGGNRVGGGLCDL